MRNSHPRPALRPLKLTPHRVALNLDPRACKPFRRYHFTFWNLHNPFRRYQFTIWWRFFFKGRPGIHNHILQKDLHHSASRRVGGYNRPELRKREARPH